MEIWTDFTKTFIHLFIPSINQWTFLVTIDAVLGAMNYKYYKDMVLAISNFIM